MSVQLRLATMIFPSLLRMSVSLSKSSSSPRTESLLFSPLNNLKLKHCPSRQSTNKQLRRPKRVVRDINAARTSAVHITVRVKMTVTPHEAWLVMKKGNVAQPTSIPHYQTTCRAKRSRESALGWRYGVFNARHKEYEKFWSACVISYSKQVV